MMHLGGGTIRINRLSLLVIGILLILFILYSFQGNGENKGRPRPQDFHFKYQTNQNQETNQLRNTKGIRVHDLLIAAVDLAIRGGEEVVAVKNSGPSELGEQIKGKTKEGAKDRVTEGDYRSHRVMYYGFRKAFPEIKVISEEHTENPAWNDVSLPSLQNEEISNILTSDEVWDPEDISVWIDPLDATQEYTENLLEYVTTMVCIAVKGKPMIGIIHKPFSKETFWAATGHGSSLNLIQMSRRVNDKIDEKLRILVSRSHTGKVQNFTSLVLAPDDKFEIMKAAGAGYKVIEVIGKKADVYLHVTAIKKWDICAGHAMLSALGGFMTTINGEELEYSSDTNPLNEKGLLAYMRPSPLINKLKAIDINS